MCIEVPGVKNIMASIFISYSRKDAALAQQLAGDLRNIGVEAWIDVDGIQAGVNWSNTIQAALDECALMILILSPDSSASLNVDNEWQYYVDQHKPIIPVLYRQTRIHFQ